MKTDVNALAKAIRDWPQRVVDAGVKTNGNGTYRPKTGPYGGLTGEVLELARSNNTASMLTKIYSILNDQTDWDRTDTGSQGWNRIIVQAGPEYVWEWLIMDRTAAWADLFTEQQRWNVAIAVAHTIKRGI